MPDPSSLIFPNDTTLIWYNAHMKNLKHWSIPAVSGSQNARTIWNLEQRINWGIGPEKISRTALKEHWRSLDIDPWKRKALSLVLR